MEMNDGLIANLITEIVVNALLIAGAVSAALYCRALAKRLSALKDPASGLGAAISTLSRHVDVLRDSIEQARVAAGEQTHSLTHMTARAEMASGRLELLLAALHENGRERPIDKKQVEARRRVRAETMAEAMVEARAEIRTEIRPNNKPNIMANIMANDRVGTVVGTAVETVAETAVKAATKAIRDDYADPPFVAYDTDQVRTRHATRHANRHEPQEQVQPQPGQPQPQDHAGAGPVDDLDGRTGGPANGRLDGRAKARSPYTNEMSDEMSDKVSWGAAP